MAKDASNDLSYFLWIDEKDKNYLGGIRHWENLKVGFEGRDIWIKNLDYMQIFSMEIQTIPAKKLFVEKEGKLFPVGSLLPEGRVPSVMWTPIGRAFPVNRPSLNHNYFGLNETLTIRIVPSEKEQQPAALLVRMEVLGKYLETAPAIRLKPLKWIVLDDQYALVLGTPLLPLEGTAYWSDGPFLFPAGFDLEFHTFRNELAEAMQIFRGTLILWDLSGNYVRIEETKWERLTRSSFQLTIQHNNN